jgi:hypothetical protein
MRAFLSSAFERFFSLFVYAHELLTYDGPPGAKSRFFTVSKSLLSLRKDLRYRIMRKNNVFRRKVPRQSLMV